MNKTRKFRIFFGDNGKLTSIIGLYKNDWEAYRAAVEIGYTMKSQVLVRRAG